MTHKQYFIQTFPIELSELTFKKLQDSMPVEIHARMLKSESLEEDVKAWDHFIFWAKRNYKDILNPQHHPTTLNKNRN